MISTLTFKAFTPFVLVFLPFVYQAFRFCPLHLINFSLSLATSSRAERSDHALPPA